MSLAAVPVPPGAVPASDTPNSAPVTPAPTSNAPVPVPAGATPAGSDTPQTPAPSPATISAVHPPTTMIGKMAQWIENVDRDIKMGTDETGIGTLLKKMGAHGVYMGNSQAVGDFMASLPLGLLKAGKGGTEVVPETLGGPKGNTVKGLEDMVGGGLQALTIPSAFVAPGAADEAGELAGEATEAAGKAGRRVLDKAGEVASEVRHGKDLAQPGAQEAVRAATGARPGAQLVEGATGKSVVDNAVEAYDRMSRDLYSQASKKAGFDVREAKQALESAQTRLKLTEGTESQEIADQAKQEISELQSKLAGASKVDPKLYAAAEQAAAKHQAAFRFRDALVKATDVDGTVDVDKLLTASKLLRFTKAGDQLVQYMGKTGADEYMTQLEKMRDIGAHAVKMQKLAKWIGKIAGAGALIEGGVLAKGALND